MRPWVELYDHHQALRAEAEEAVTKIREVLRSLGDGQPSVLRKGVQSRLQPQKNPKTGLYGYVLRGESGEDVVLKNLPEKLRKEVHLQEACLHVLLLLDRTRNHLHQLTVMVKGKRRDGSPWTVAVHLPDDRETEKNPHGDRQGHGACGHAALHCHVGPTLDTQPEVRVPLPPLAPGEVVAWVMSQVIPTVEFEPAPWPKVVEARSQPRS